MPFGERVDVVGGITVRLQRAGHILGAVSARVAAGGSTLLFSGDLGRPDDTLMKPPDPIAPRHMAVKTSGVRRCSVR